MRELGRAHGWIRLVSIPSDANPARGRSSVRAFNAGVMAEPALADLVTGLDADVSFGPGYFDSLRREFERNPRLGIASGLCYESSGDQLGAGSRDPAESAWSLPHVPEGMPGATPAAGGRCGWDGIAVVRARIRGWETAIIPDLAYFHHRPTGARDVSRFASYTDEGQAYYMWYRPSYMFLRTLYRAMASRSRGRGSRMGLCTLGSQPEAEASERPAFGSSCGRTSRPRTGCSELAKSKVSG